MPSVVATRTQSGVLGRKVRLTTLLLEIQSYQTVSFLNTFAAILAKRPIKVPNFKSLRLPPHPPPLLHEHVKGFLSKCTALKVRFVIGPSDILFTACKCTPFCPEIVQAGAVKGLGRDQLRI